MEHRTGVLSIWSCTLVVTHFGVICFAALSLAAQAARGEMVDPRAFGVNLPPGAVRYAPDERYLMIDDSGQAVVARLHAEVGGYRILVLPDGRLSARPASATTRTSRPFAAVEKETLAAQLIATEFPEFRSRITNRYVFLYNTSEPFALATSRILETMFPGVSNYAEAQGIEVAEPATPLVVVMFRTEAEFQQYRPIGEGIIAHYDPVSNRVALYEQSKAAQAVGEVAVAQAISTIAHEGAHQILHNIGVQQRLSRWPLWLNEGLAEYFAPTSTGRRLRWKGAGEVNDLRMLELERYLKGRQFDSAPGQLVQHTVLAEQLTSTGYASAWALTHYLAQVRRNDFNAYVKKLSDLQPLQGFTDATREGVVPSQLRSFSEQFGGDTAQLEKQMAAHLRKQPYVDPFAGQPHYVGLILVRQPAGVQREANVFHSESLALRWQQQWLEQLDEPARRRAQTDVRRFPNRLVAERFAANWLSLR